MNIKNIAVIAWVILGLFYIVFNLLPSWFVEVERPWLWEDFNNDEIIPFRSNVRVIFDGEKLWDISCKNNEVLINKK